MRGLSFQSAGDFVIRLFALWKGSPLSKGGLALITLGGALLTSSWWLPLVLSWLGYTPEQAVVFAGRGERTAIALFCLLMGAVMLIIPSLSARTTKRPPVIAVRHQSFDGNAKPLRTTDLPFHLHKAEIIPIDLDQSSTFKAGILEDPKAALRQQGDLKAKVAGLVQAHPEAVVAYCGKAHIPLAFTAAHLVFSEVPLMYFEFDRTTGGWRYLDDAVGGDDLELTTKTTQGVAQTSGDAVIKVEISYRIKAEDIAAIVPEPAAQVEISIAKPRIDCIATSKQVELIAKAFREALDTIGAAKRINVFLAAPMSVVVALGRLMSPTIHGSVVVHNFTEKTSPHYAWGIDVNAKSGPVIVKNRNSDKGD